MSWSDVLTMAPTYPPAGPAVEYPSPASRRPSECFSEMSMPGSRRGSSAGFVSDMENKGQWQSIGSESNSKSPLANFGFFKNLTEKKTTRGFSRTTPQALMFDLIRYRWSTTKEERSEAGQQTRLDAQTRAQPSSSEVTLSTCMRRNFRLTQHEGRTVSAKRCTSKRLSKKCFASKIPLRLQRGKETHSLKRIDG